VDFHGLTGKVSFKEGVRSGVKMDLLKLRHQELDKVCMPYQSYRAASPRYPVGEFTIDSGLNITKLHAFREFGYNNITLKVTTIEVDFHGLTGKVSFKEGVRSGVKMDLLKLRHQELDKVCMPYQSYRAASLRYPVGEFTIDSGLNITKLHAFREFGYNNITLKVTTIESPPYIKLRKTNGSDVIIYEGFCIDLLNAISKELGFNYELYLVPDKRFGAENASNPGQWNGLVRELILNKADLAVAPMTISYAREEVIDFTKPFMNLGIGILFKIPTQMPTRLFSFMNPLAVDIWLYVVVAYILVSSTLFIVARFSPFEWQNPHPCEKVCPLGL
ncbi:unnamed protein product, partial [Oppiella nova]